MPLKALLSGSFGAGGSARKKGASGLSDSEKLNMLDELESSGLGWFWSCDKEGNLTYLSAAISERVELPLESLIGQPLAGVFEARGGDGRTQSLALKLGARKAFTGFEVSTQSGNRDIVIRLSGRPCSSLSSAMRS